MCKMKRSILYVYYIRVYRISIMHVLVTMRRICFGKTNIVFALDPSYQTTLLVKLRNEEWTF